MFYKKRKSEGFTLIELMIAMGLVAGLSLVMASQLEVSNRVINTTQQGFEHTELITTLYTTLSKEELCRSSFQDVVMEHRVEDGADVFESCLESDPHFRIADASGRNSILDVTVSKDGSKDWRYGRILITTACLKWVQSPVNRSLVNAAVTLSVSTARRKAGEKPSSFGLPAIGEKRIILLANLKQVSGGVGIETCSMRGLDSGTGGPLNPGTVLPTPPPPVAPPPSDPVVVKFPSHAVIAFNLTACPSGWTEFSPLRGRTIVGANPARFGDISPRAVGEQGGEETPKLTLEEMPAHRHLEPDLWDGNSNSSILDDYGPYAVRKSGNRQKWKGEGEDAHTLPAGGGKPHNIMQPYAVLLYCEKD